MKENTINRRDALKVLGSLGAAALTQEALKSTRAIQQKASGKSLPNILIVVFDTLSARHMSLYGYQRRTTPNLERFAQSATTYHHHYSASNFTQSSTASILTGDYPWSHRSLDFYEELLKSYESRNVFSYVSSRYQTIAYTHNLYVRNILDQFEANIDLLKPLEDLVLSEGGYFKTIFRNDKLLGDYATKRWLNYFSSPSYSLFLNPVFTTVADSASEAVSARYKSLYPMGLCDGAGYRFKLEDAIDWITKATGVAQTPFLGYFHLLPPHEPYMPRAEFSNLFAGDNFHLLAKPEGFFTQGITERDQRALCQRYDEFIAHVDSEFGRLVESLNEQGILDNTYLIFTSDHGQLFERGLHGHANPMLYESLIHVPLLIHSPGQKESLNVYGPTSSVDLIPTILDITGPTGDLGLEGQRLPGLGREENRQRIIFSMHAAQNAKRSPLTKVTYAAIQWPFKLIEYLGYPGLDDTIELFDIENDPEELINLAQHKPQLVSFLSEEIRKNQALAEEKSLQATGM